MQNNSFPSECPYQKGLTTIICEAGRLIVPSIEEARKYCEGDYRDCPNYQAAVDRENALMAALR